jgi:alpha-beta hydrolase superfamily lysophospholipase
LITGQNFFHLSDNTRLRINIFDNGKKDWLFVLHGLGEHYERHLYLSELLKDQYNIIFYDHRGHGMSGGPRATIDYFSRFAEDFKEVLTYILKGFAVDSYSIYAHSMGTLVANDFYKNFSDNIKKPQKMFFSSPVVGFHGVGKILQYSTSTITGLIRDLPMSIDIEPDSDHERYSHDENVLQKLVNDPLVNQHTESRLMIEILHKATELYEEKMKYQCPVYVVVGSMDKVVCPRSAVEYFSYTEQVDQILIVPGGFHELFVETPKYRKPFIDFLSSVLITQTDEDDEFAAPKIRIVDQ